MTDQKVSPKHYMLGDGLQTIDVIFKLLAMKDCDPFIAYCWGNVLKYMMRWTEHDGATDLRKAHRYLTWILEYQDTGKISHEADSSSAPKEPKIQACPPNPYSIWEDSLDAVTGRSRSGRTGSST